MNMSWNKKNAIGALIVCFVVASGCSSHSVNYKVNSDSIPQSTDDHSATVSGDRAGIPAETLQGRTFPYGGDTMDPSASSPQAVRPSWNNVPFVVDPSSGEPGIPPYAGLRYFEPSSGFTGEGADYGHNYEGVAGSDSLHGPVTGFGTGRNTESVNPDPEAWARAYLGKEAPMASSSQRPHHPDSAYDPLVGGADYGHNYPGVPGEGPGYGPVTGFGSKSGDLVYPDPETWARGYLRDDRSDEALPLERVDEGTMIAKVNPTYPSEMRENYEQEPPSTHGFPESSVHSHDLGFAHTASIQASAIEDIYFDFDSWQITETGKQAIEADANWLKANADATVTIEGHCDARGTQSYNLVLGKKRAEAVKTYLVDLGVDPERINVVSYGEERPFCTAATETCYQQNRRGHVVVNR